MGTGRLSVYTGHDGYVPVWNRFQKCTRFNLFQLTTSLNDWNRSQLVQKRQLSPPPNNTKQEKGKSIVRQNDKGTSRCVKVTFNKLNLALLVE